MFPRLFYQRKKLLAAESAPFILSFSRRSQSGAESPRATESTLVRDERLNEAVPMHRGLQNLRKQLN